MAVSKEEKKKTFDLFDRAPADREKKGDVPLDDKNTQKIIIQNFLNGDRERLSR